MQADNKMKVSLIFGTRPEAIKFAPVIRAMRKSERFEPHVCVTGQHREMLDQVMDCFELTSDVDLALMRSNQTLGGLSSRLMEKLDQYLRDQQPELVLVQGDTATAFVGALAAYYQRIPVGHLEAGLRTFNLYSPWPEEGNRALISRIADLHFAPTQMEAQFLEREGIDSKKIFVTGNTVVDALLWMTERLEKTKVTIPGLPVGLYESDQPLVLITGHRRENFGEGFASMCRAIARLAKRFPGVQFVYPVHLNPRVRKPVFDILGKIGSAKQWSGNIHIIEPLAYDKFVAMMDRSTLILTDSGGIQEEAPSLGKPVLVMRDTTERQQAVLAGTVKLVGTCEQTIVREATRLLAVQEAYDEMAQAHNPYGDGFTTARLMYICESFLRPERVLEDTTPSFAHPTPISQLPVREQTHELDPAA